MMRASFFLALVPLAVGCSLVRHTDDLTGGTRPDAGGVGDDDDGSAPGVPVVFAANRNSPTAITSVSSNMIYWTETNAVVSASAGGDINTEVTLDVTPSSVSVSDGFITWSSQAGGVVGACTFGRAGGCRYTGGNADPGDSLVAAGPPDVDSPAGALNQTSNFFWINRNNGALALCEAVPCDTDAVNEIRNGDDRPAAMAKNDSFVFWVDEGGDIMSAEIDADENGEHPVARLARGEPEPVAIAALGKSIYWANRGDGSIKTSFEDGSGASTIATGQDKVHSIAIDDSGAVYWTTYSDSGSVSMCPATGCPSDGPRVLATGQPQAYGVAVAGDTVYWTVANAVMKIAKPK